MDTDGIDENKPTDHLSPAALPLENANERSGESSPSVQERTEEQRKIRRLQMTMNMVISVISQDENLAIDQAAELVAGSKAAALAMFPDKELAYNLIYKPRLERLMRERFHIQ